MNGIGIMRNAMPPKSVPAHLKVNFAYICVVKSGNAVPARFPVRIKRCSVRFPSWLKRYIEAYCRDSGLRGRKMRKVHSSQRKYVSNFDAKIILGDIPVRKVAEHCEVHYECGPNKQLKKATHISAQCTWDRAWFPSWILTYHNANGHRYPRHMRERCPSIDEHWDRKQDASCASRV